jgi:hypothetical protein
LKDKIAPSKRKNNASKEKAALSEKEQNFLDGT